MVYDFVIRVIEVKGFCSNTWADVEKASTLVGYKLKIPLEESLKREILWMRDIYK